MFHHSGPWNATIVKPPPSQKQRRRCPQVTGCISGDAHGGSGRNGLRGDRNMWFVTVKIGKHTKNHGKSRFLMGKSTIIGNMLG